MNAVFKLSFQDEDELGDLDDYDDEDLDDIMDEIKDEL